VARNSQDAAAVVELVNRQEDLILKLRKTTQEVEAMLWQAIDAAAINWDQMAGDWKQFKGKVKEKWGKFTDDDLTTIAGKRDQLAGLLQQGYEKDQAEKDLDEFSRALKR
jgi:uncharacterized protein YjbJ (UPF0337 family)